MNVQRTIGLTVALLAVIATLAVTLIFQSQRLTAASLRAETAEAAVADYQRLQALNSTQARARAMQSAKTAKKAQEVQHEIRGRVTADADAVGRLQELADTINSGIMPGTGAAHP